VGEHHGDKMGVTRKTHGGKKSIIKKSKAVNYMKKFRVDR
jgi:hypothetical protein